jgi:hypothetical protein
MNWDANARNLLKAEIVKRGVTYERLAKRMQDIGVEETTSSIANKMSRGTFPFVFFLQCMRALGVDSVAIEVPVLNVARNPVPPDHEKRE